MPLIIFVVVFVIGIIAIILSLAEEDVEVDPASQSFGSNSQINPNSGSNNNTTQPNSGVFGDDLNQEGLRDNFTLINGDGTDTSTIMFYLLGSDLESDGGFASEDLYEILEADFGDNVNFIVMTGGSLYWYMDEVRSDTCQYWQVKDGELLPLESDLGLLNMTSPETLTNFVNYSAAAFPADRYSLILWDHGGGTFSGFGSDENFPGSTLYLDSLDEAFAGCNVKFDIVGFDACLMGTAEVAMMLEPYADYLLASQELEPGIGWYYSDWLTEYSLDPSMSTVSLGQLIIDDYVERCEYEYSNPEATLSLVELRQMPYVYDVLTDFFDNATEDIYNNEYIKISTARNEAKYFGEGDYEQIDIIDFINKADVEGGELAIAAVNSAVSYRNNSSDVYDAYGLAMYFPYDYPYYYSDMQSLLYEVGYTPEYMDFFDTFVSAMSGGQIGYNESFGVEYEEEYFFEDWYDSDTADLYEEEYEGEYIGEYIIIEKDDGYVLQLTDEQWAEISTIELQVLLDDGEGYIDLGSDNVYEFDEDGDLKIEFDYTWVSLDGYTVPFYMEAEYTYSDDEWYTYGYVPAFLNYDEYVEVIIQWDNENPYGYVMGYRNFTEMGEPAGKGYFELEPGDELEWIIDFYTYDGEFEDSYTFNELFVVPHGEITVSYEDVGDMDALVYFVLTDYYNNTYDTEAVFYTD